MCLGGVYIYILYIYIYIYTYINIIYIYIYIYDLFLKLCTRGSAVFLSTFDSKHFESNTSHISKIQRLYLMPKLMGDWF